MALRLGIETQIGSKTPFIFFLFLTFIYSSLLNVFMIRISLDLSAGTFTKVEELCKADFRNKADYLRLLIDDDLGRRKGKR